MPAGCAAGRRSKLLNLRHKGGRSAWAFREHGDKATLGSVSTRMNWWRSSPGVRTLPGTPVADLPEPVASCGGGGAESKDSPILPEIPS